MSTEATAVGETVTIARERYEELLRAERDLEELVGSVIDTPMRRCTLEETLAVLGEPWEWKDEED